MSFDLRTNSVQAADPASKTIYTFTDTGALHNAIKVYGYIPVHADGTPMDTVYLKEYDGYILDGAPINVWIDGVWLEGQKEAMEAYWTSGQVRRPPADILNAGAIPMPAEVKAQTEAYQRTQAGFLGMDTGTLLAIGAGIAAIWWISKR